ncbi:hypothetical protein O0I10_000366 [Lichtheimia ornata]|uniref:Uncharacterized protein n=1 Tax=Lichtheimia ornata TaxID=688661 RepID=A0AAD7Y586_9FUNG|nr:uncharacterized protein O0I10_000366 [Lichtheimia ornata]KAJ8664088.1 hypothetical protein O0I10_000366 [Lichtheimia ornata]
MPLENAIEHILVQSSTCASIKLKDGSPSIPDQRQPLAASNLMRDADIDECKVFHVSNNEHDVKRYTEAVRNTSASSSVQTVERLLTALAALNKICMIPDIAAAMDEAQEEYGSRDANIQFLRTSCDEIRVDMEQISRANNAHQSKEKQKMENQRLKKIPRHDVDHQRQQEESDLERAIALKERELENYRRESGRQRQRISEAEKELDENQESMEIDQTSPSVTLQDTIRDRLYMNNDYAASLEAARHELVNQILSDRVSGVDPERKVMAKVIDILQSQHDHCMPLQDLRASVSDLVASLGLREGAGSQAIYKLSVNSLVYIDRSDPDAALVKLQ